MFATFCNENSFCSMGNNGIVLLENVSMVLAFMFICSPNFLIRIICLTLAPCQIMSTIVMCDTGNNKRNPFPVCSQLHGIIIHCRCIIFEMEMQPRLFVAAERRKRLSF